MEKPPKKKRSLGKRILRITLKTFLFIFLFFILLILLIQTAPVQNLIRKKAVSWLQKKLDTKVEVGRIYVGFPKNIILENIYVEDRQKDTLLSAGKIKANLNLYQVIFKGNIDFENIELNTITAKVKRELPDTTFNFQFIIDAFDSGNDDANEKDTASSSSSFAIRKVQLDKIRLVYKDVLTGNDAAVYFDHLDTKIDRFDLDKMDFDVSSINLKGLAAKLYQSKPLVEEKLETERKQEASEPVSLKLALGKATLDDIKLDYKNDVSSTYANIAVGNFYVKPDKIDLDKKTIRIDDFNLENTVATIRLGKSEEAKQVKEETEEVVKVQKEAGWKIIANSIGLANNAIQFDNDNAPRQKEGMDYAHLKVNKLMLKTDDFIFSDDSIAGKIKTASFTEQSGFVLQQLQTDFLYGNKNAYLQNLYLKTPGTELQRKAAIQYTSIESLSSSLADMKVDLDISNSKILVKDVLTFVPSLKSQPAFADANATWFINSRISGKISDLNIQSLQLSGLQDTKMNVKGTIKGLPNADKTYANLSINSITTSKRDIEKFIPKGMLPQNITLPNRINLSGDIKGNAEKMAADLALKTDLGNARVKAIASQLTNAQAAVYDATVTTESIDLGTILQDKKTYGPISATFTAKGKGYDIKTANAVVDGMINSMVYNQYEYNNFKLAGKIENQLANVEASIHDANIDFSLQASANFSTPYPAITLSGTVDSIKMQPLHLAENVRVYRGKIEADFPNTNIDSLEGSLQLSQFLLVHDDKRLQLDTIQLHAGNDSTGKFVRLNSQVLNAAIEGQYKITALGNILQQSIQPYFNVGAPDSIMNADPYNFRLNVYMKDNPALQLVAPSVKRLDSLTLRSHFSSDSGWAAIVKAPAMDIGTSNVRNFELNAGTNDAKDAAKIKATVERIASGSSIELNNTTIDATIADNTIDFGLNIEDRAEKDKYKISAVVKQPQEGEYAITVKPDNLLLNYNSWTIATDNEITIKKEGLNAHNFLLSRNTQQLSVNSQSATPNAPLDASFTNFRLATLTGFVQPDSTLVDGLLNGKITFTDLNTEPVFAGDLTIQDLNIKNDTAGNVHILVDNKTNNAYAVDVTLDGRGNDLKLKGNYYVQLVNGKSFDFDLAINKLPVTTAQAFSAGAIRNGSGSVNGQFKLAGTVDKPSLNGDLNFDQAAFNLSMLNNYFRIDKEKIRIDGTGIHFDRFQVKDSANNTLTIDGIAATNNLKNYKFDMDVRANNFRALNSTKKDNDLFYGTLYFSTNLKITGTELSPSVDGRLTVNEDTKMTVVLPQRDPGVVDREGIVVFVDKDAPLNDSLFMLAYDSLNVSDFRGMNISVNLQVDKEADFTLIVDQGNGDFLNVKGEANLTCSIDPGGKVTLTGTYELEEGAYELTFNFLKRKFEIQKGSRIVWEGEPTDANVDLTAIYVANAAPLDLVKNQLAADITANQRNTYLQKLPFNVYLKMEGELLQPLITFDIQLPEDKSYVVSNDIVTAARTRLEQLRQEEGEMNKQVFSLLLLNRFMAEDPFSSSGGGLTAGTFARQSVSKLLTEQLNKLADDLVKGVDLNFDVLSSEDYTTGQRRDRTDLNVGLSKNLLNDRLTVSVGSNFELEGPQNTNQQATNIAGNIAVDYHLSKDNRYLLRAYRKNEYQGIIEGYIVETGLSFLIRVDYNKFREIFLSQEQRRKQREQRRQNREQSQTTTEQNRAVKEEAK